MHFCRYVSGIEPQPFLDGNSNVATYTTRPVAVDQLYQGEPLLFRCGQFNAEF